MNPTGSAHLELVCEGLIPGLPDELALMCLATLSHGHHGVLECVSRRWRDALRSEEYSRLKAREGLCGDWLFVLTDEKPGMRWSAYDPGADRWHALPPAPGTDPRSTHCGFACVALRERFLVLGGYPVRPPLEEHGGGGGCSSYRRPAATREVMSFDPYRNRWSEVAGMRTPRCDFACSAVRGRVLVAGGWEDLPPMPTPLRSCFSVSHDGRFHVVGRSASEPRHFIFDPAWGSWAPAPAAWQLHRLPRNPAAALDGRLYAILERGLAALEGSGGAWSVLDGPPLFDLPDHRRKLQPSGCGFAGLRGKLYLVGGKAIRYDMDARVFDIVKFACTRYCDPAAAPLQWRDVRPLFRSRGAVLGCAALQQ
ncbi:unnamed protein product [Spirodela intermedia]|uniref:F-box domain-containing protein n=1 Tax=Spirodela intermedia TaxID=51605 RepID=A0A7I8KLF6_SPIIN|nr:unnamed protein product [Spirodela intermedia]